jgi:uncharacterized membrane protein YgcG
MRRLLHLSLLVSAASLTSLPHEEASAQTICAAGRAANGQCVNAAMATAAITTAVVFSQPKISFTAYPVLPASDRLYRWPHQLNPNQLVPTRVGPGPRPAGGDSGGGGGAGGGAGSGTTGTDGGTGPGAGGGGGSGIGIPD